MRKSFFFGVLVFELSLFSVVNYSFGDASDTPPVTLSTPCPDESPTYIWSTIQKSPWSLKEFYAIPVSFDSVESWPESSAFNFALLTVLQSPANPENYSVACTSIWEQFIEGQSRIFLKFARNIDTTRRLVQCQNEFWTLTDEESEEVLDESDFILVGSSEGFDVTTTTSEELRNLSQATLDALNVQLGADTTPFDTWRQQ